MTQIQFINCINTESVPQLFVEKILKTIIKYFSYFSGQLTSLDPNTKQEQQQLQHFNQDIPNIDCNENSLAFLYLQGSNQTNPVTIIEIQINITDNNTNSENVSSYEKSLIKSLIQQKIQFHTNPYKGYLFQNHPNFNTKKVKQHLKITIGNLYPPNQVLTTAYQSQKILQSTLIQKYKGFCISSEDDEYSW